MPEHWHALGESSIGSPDRVNPHTASEAAASLDSYRVLRLEERVRILIAGGTTIMATIRIAQTRSFETLARESESATTRYGPSTSFSVHVHSSRSQIIRLVLPVNLKHWAVSRASTKS